MNGLAFALERGVDALVVSAPLLLDGDDGVALLEALQIAKAQRLERDAASKADESVSSAEEGVEALIDAELTGVINGGVADRVCLDFTRLLNEGEGSCWARPPSCSHWYSVRRRHQATYRPDHSA